MDIPVLVEQVGDEKYVARSGEPFALSTEGATFDEALSNLEGAMRGKLVNGTRLATVHLPDANENPWAAGAGCLKDDPLFDEWVEAMKENRRQMDAEPSV